jgi:superfamily II DNA or RNA helicase
MSKRLDFNNIKLRPHQEYCKNIITKDTKTKSFLVWLLTGAGKTILFYSIANHFKNKRFLFIAPQISLAWQTTEQGDTGILQGSTAKRLHKRIIIGTLLTVKNRVESRSLDLGDFDYVFFDEAHELPDIVGDLEDKAIKKGCRVVKLSATPYDGNGVLLEHAKKSRIIGDQFDFDYMIENGTLCPVVIKRISSVDTTYVTKNANGEYNEKQLQKELSKSDIDVVETTLRNINKSLPTVIVSGSVKDADILYKEFKERGLRVEVLHSKAEKKINGKVLKGKNLTSYVVDKVRKLEVDIVCSVKMLTTGVDAPSIGNIVLATKIGARRTYIQTIGRGLRRFDGKNILNVIDLYGTIDEHGHPFTKFTPLLEKPVKKRTKKTCECGADVLTAYKEVDRFIDDNFEVIIRKCSECGEEDVNMKLIPAIECKNCEKMSRIGEIRKEYSKLLVQCEHCNNSIIYGEILPRKLIVLSDADRSRAIKDIEHIIESKKLSSFKIAFSRFKSIARGKDLAYILDVIGDVTNKYSQKSIELLEKRIKERVENDPF